MSTPHDDYGRSLRRRHFQANAFGWACSLATWCSVLILATLLIAVSYRSVGWISGGFLARFDSFRPEKAGIFAGLMGSFWLIGMTAVFCVPIGVGAAIYLEEYARSNWLTRVIQLNVSNLAGVPSIVYGMLGFTAFVRMFGVAHQQYLLWLGFTTVKFSIPFGRSVIAGALTLTLLSLPVVIIASQEALRSVPPSIRHAAYALGATKWQTIRAQVLPAALPGILTGVILALSRALGETAPLAVLGAATFITFAPGKKGLLQAPFDPFTAMPLQIYNWVEEIDRKFQNVAAAGIVVLLVALLAMNGSAIYIRHHFQKKIRW
ncbi:MAG: phosphate ABC transporter, permease protein PstA [Planctomycetales bacterium 12-60-4]|nr:MAG: phosphate ABC transporter, permease protein PstA [Planctomycetales bacterium 12-60-4]